MHKALVVFHRWLGLATALFIFVIALSGSALVFESDLDHALNPRLWNAPGTGPWLPLDSLVARVGAPVSGVTLPPEPGRPLVASAGNRQVFLDPHSGIILGTRDVAAANRGLPRRLHRLHVELLVAGRGRTVVGVVTLAALLLTLTGVIVWWRDKRWRIQWSASWRRIVFDLHHTLGLAASVVLLVMTASGAALHYEAIGRGIMRLDDLPQTPAPKQPASTGARMDIGYDSAAHVAARALPLAALTLISFPQASDQPIRATLRFADDKTPAGRSRVYVDRYTGAVLGVQGTHGVGAGTRLNVAMRGIHTGDVLGAPTRAIWFVCALILASQAVTGFAMWWNASVRPVRSRRDRSRPPPEGEE